jgi:hypothetical protein
MSVVFDNRPMRAERRADCGYVKIERAWSDGHAKPYAPNQSIPGDELVGFFDQYSQQVEGSASEWDSGAANS